MTLDTSPMDIPAEFARMCGSLFPAWTTWKLWQVRHELASEYTGDGYCDCAARTIWIMPSERGDAFRRTLAHEIVHAILGEDEADDHGPEFWTRLRAIGKIAGQHSLTSLATLISQDANEWEALHYVRRVMANEKPSLQQVLDGLRETCGLVPADLGERSWRIEAVYEVIRNA